MHCLLALNFYLSVPLLRHLIVPSYNSWTGQNIFCLVFVARPATLGETRASDRPDHIAGSRAAGANALAFRLLTWTATEYLQPRPGCGIWSRTKPIGYLPVSTALSAPSSHQELETLEACSGWSWEIPTGSPLPLDLYLATGYQPYSSSWLYGWFQRLGYPLVAFASTFSCSSHTVEFTL